MHKYAEAAKELKALSAEAAADAAADVERLARVYDLYAGLAALLNRISKRCAACRLYCFRSCAPPASLCDACRGGGCGARCCLQADKARL